jgi:hypothetical protein
MILEYSVKNYTVFKETARLSFVASNYDKTTLELENVEHVPQKRLRILRAAVVHGANASGKTKLFESLAFFRKFVLDSSKESQIGEDIPTKPFLLCEETKNEPSEFEIIFFQNQAIFRMDLEVTRKKFFPNGCSQSEGGSIRFSTCTIDHTCKRMQYFKKGNLLRSENWCGTMRSCFLCSAFNDAISSLLSSGSNTV